MPKVVKGLHNFSLSNLHRLKRGQTLEQFYAANNPNAPLVVHKRPNLIISATAAQETHCNHTKTAAETQLEQIEVSKNVSSTYIETYFNDDNEEVEINAPSDATDNFHETIRASNSLEEVAASLITLYLAGKMTKNAIRMTIAFSKALRPDKSIPSSLDQCISLLGNRISYNKKFYCKQCNVPIQELRSEIKQRTCSTCDNHIQFNNICNINEQIEALLAREGLYEKMCKKKRSPDANLLNDIQDGNMYNWFVRNEIKDEYDLETVFTFTLNTDGISQCSRSSLSIWPVYLVIN